jgi:nucleoside-diphosphate-sugar epimerase
VIREAELECGQRFLNAYEWSKFNAERLLRAASGHVPVTVVRPSIVVGDSADGHIACFSTIYEPLRRIAEGRVRRIPGRAEVPLDIVPLDHVAEVAARLVARSGADLRTYHLTSGPEGAIPVGDLVDRAIRWAAARGFAARGEPARFVDRARSRRTGLQVFFDYLWHAKAFDTAALRAALPDGLPSCPNVRDYLDTLLDYHWRSVGQSAGAAVAAGGAR